MEVSERKRTTSRCEICGKEFQSPDGISGKCERRCQYHDSEFKTIIICPDCNYQVHLSECKNLERITALVLDMMPKLQDLMEEYAIKLDDIVSDSIVSVVKDYRVQIRPTLDMLFKNPCFEVEHETDQQPSIVQERLEILKRIAKMVDVWDGHRIDKITKYKIEELRRNNDPIKNDKWITGFEETGKH